MDISQQVSPDFYIGCAASRDDEQVYVFTFPPVFEIIQGNVPFTWKADIGSHSLPDIR